jgi:hypothetical protein
MPAQSARQQLELSQISPGAQQVWSHRALGHTQIPSSQVKYGSQVPHSPSQPSEPHSRPVQSGVQLPSHWQVEKLHVWLVSEQLLGQSPRQPSLPQHLPWQSGTHSPSQIP